MSSYLDKTGLAYLWGKIKEQLNTKVDVPPFAFISDGAPLPDWRIYGNTGGVGDEALFPNCLENNYQSKEINGLTVTVDGENITVSGTATANTNLCIYNNSGSTTALAYQIIENGVYELSGSPEESGTGAGHYIISYNYDDAIGGTPAHTSNRLPVSGVTIDNTNGDYRYLCVYIAIWNGAVLDNVTFTPTLRKHGCKIPVTCGEVTTDIYLDEPLGKGEVLTMAEAGVSIPTAEGINTLDVGTSVKPEAVWVKYEQEMRA